MAQAGAGERLRVRGASGELRGTQSFVRVMQWCWGHPSAVALEVVWRWVFGVAVLWFGWHEVWPRVEAATGGTALARLSGLSLLEPTRTVLTLSRMEGVVWPVLWEVGRVAVPLFALGWVLLSTMGRWAVLRRAGVAARPRLGAVVLLQMGRLAALGAMLWVWVWGLRWATEALLLRPIAERGEPALVGFFAVAILSTLLVFVVWSLVSYAVSLPPLLAMAEGMEAGRSAREGMVAGPLRMKLIEINLVMGIVKVALVVLLMVFSACPLPFESVITTEFLVWWTGAIGLIYFVASDFFHVARQVAMLRLWEFYRGEAPGV